MAAVPDAGEEGRVGAAGVLVALCPVGLFVLGGPAGGAVGVAAALVWLAGPLYGFAVGQLGLVLVVDQPVPTERVAALQAAVFVLLLAALLRTDRSAWPTVAFGGLALGIGGGVLLAVGAGVGSVPVAAALVVTVAAGAYLLHRYALLALGELGPAADAGR